MSGRWKKIKPLQLIVGVTVILANMAAGWIHKSTIIMSLLCLEKSPYRWESKGRPLNRHLGKQKGQLWLISFNVGQLFKPLHWQQLKNTWTNGTPLTTPGRIAGFTMLMWILISSNSNCSQPKLNRNSFVVFLFLRTLSNVATLSSSLKQTSTIKPWVKIFPLAHRRALICPVW